MAIIEIYTSTLIVSWAQDQSPCGFHECKECAKIKENVA